MGSSETEVTDGCELCVGTGNRPYILERTSALTTEPSLQPQVLQFKKWSLGHVCRVYMKRD